MANAGLLNKFRASEDWLHDYREDFADAVPGTSQDGSFVFLSSMSETVLTRVCNLTEVHVLLSSERAARRFFGTLGSE